MSIAEKYADYASAHHIVPSEDDGERPVMDDEGIFLDLASAFEEDSE